MAGCGANGKTLRQEPIHNPAAEKARSTEHRHHRIWVNAASVWLHRHHSPYLQFSLNNELSRRTLTIDHGFTSNSDTWAVEQGAERITRMADRGRLAAQSK
jgi:hypothetical protein